MHFCLVNILVTSLDQFVNLRSVSKFGVPSKSIGYIEFGLNWSHFLIACINKELQTMYFEDEGNESAYVTV